MPVNAAELQWYLEGITFPATKNEVVNLARDNNATDETMELLEELPDREYTSPDDVIHAAGVIEEEK
jgi:hypothetical protein